VSKIVHTRLVNGQAHTGGGVTVPVAALAERNAVDRVGQEGVWVPTETYRALVGATSKARTMASARAEGRRFDGAYVCIEIRDELDRALALLREADTEEGV
jgi:hypothetical protein